MRRLDEAELANPWWTIWFRPRRTVRWIVDGQVPPNWMPVVVLGAVGVLLNVVNAWLAIPAAPRVALARWSLISLLTMLFWVLCGPFVLALYGRRRGGVGNSRQLRHALAWSYAPIAVSTLSWIPLWIITDGAAYSVEFALDGPLRFVALLLFLAISVARVWSLVIAVVAVAEVQEFSLWRAFDSLFLLFVLTLIASLSLIVVVLRLTRMLAA